MLGGIKTFMAKSSRKSSSQGSPSQGPKSPNNNFNLPEIKNHSLFINDFIKSLPDPVKAVKAILILIAGMVAVAQITLRVKNLKPQDIPRLPSANYYIKKVIVNNSGSRLAIGLITAFTSLNLFNNANEVNDFLDACNVAAPKGRIIPNINRNPNEAPKHRGGLLGSVTGKCQAFPVYYPNNLASGISGWGIRDIILVAQSWVFSPVDIGDEKSLAKDIALLLLPNNVTDLRLTFPDKKKYLLIL